jgi:hypothetical protein
MSVPTNLVSLHVPINVVNGGTGASYFTPGNLISGNGTGNFISTSTPAPTTTNFTLNWTGGNIPSNFSGTSNITQVVTGNTVTLSFNQLSGTIVNPDYISSQVGVLTAPPNSIKYYQICVQNAGTSSNGVLWIYPDGTVIATSSNFDDFAIGIAVIFSGSVTYAIGSGNY